jgi:transposase
VILSLAMNAGDSLSADVETLKSMLVAERAARMAAEREAQYRALLIEKLNHDPQAATRAFGQSPERGALLEQLELQLAYLGEDTAQAEAAARTAAATAANETITVQSFERRKPARRPLRSMRPASR